MTLHFAGLRRGAALLAAVLLRCSGLPWLIRERLTRHKAAIILYHDPSPETLARHLRYLSRHYTFVPFAKLVDAIHSKDWSAIPPKALVIHIDDGYLRNYALRQLFHRYGITPTVYLCSHVVGTNRRFWTKLHGGQVKALRLVDNRRLLKKLASEANYDPKHDCGYRSALSREEIVELKDCFDFQSHGCYHFSLLTYDDTEMRRDVQESKMLLEDIIGKPCEHFSYPFGDYSDREIRQLKDSGYRSGRTTEPGWNQVNTDPFRLKIVADVPDDPSENRLCLQMTGIPRFTKRYAYLLVTRRLYALRAAFLMRRRWLTPEVRPGQT